MFKAAKHLRPRLARGVSQVLAEPTAWNQSPVLVTTLPNGVRVATKETFGETTSIGVHINAGVRDEKPGAVGACHVLEQLAFSGTAKRPRAELEGEVEAMGGLLSMAMGREQSSYSISVPSGAMRQGLDVVTDLVTGVPVGSFAKEKEAIMAKEVEKPTRAVIEDRLHMCAWRDCSLGLSGVGPFDDLAGMGEGQLAEFVAENFTAEKMVLAAAGPVQHEEVVALAASALGGVGAGKPAPGVAKPYFCGAELLYRNDEMGPTAYVSVGWESVPWKSPDAVTFMVMQSIIGSYKKNEGLVPGTISGNRVANAVANKMQVGCADEYEAFNCFYRDTGMFGFYIACDEVAVEHAIGELMFGANLLSFSVTDEEVERGKRELKCALFSGGDSAAATCAKVGEQVLAYGRGIPPAELSLRIEAVDAEEVKRVAWKYLNDNEVAATGLGPLHGMPQYYDLRRQTIMHRY